VLSEEIVVQGGSRYGRIGTRSTELLGNCLYDKTYTTEIVKVKVKPVSDHSDLDEPGSNELPIQPKFNKDELHRRPEFQDVKPKVATVPISAAQKPVAPKLPNANTNLNIPTRSPTLQNQANPAHCPQRFSRVQALLPLRVLQITTDK